MRLAEADDGDFHLSYGKPNVKLTAARMAKCAKLFSRRQLGGRVDEREFERALFCLLLRCDPLDGGGF